MKREDKLHLQRKLKPRKTTKNLTPQTISNIISVFPQTNKQTKIKTYHKLKNPEAIGDQTELNN